MVTPKGLSTRVAVLQLWIPHGRTIWIADAHRDDVKARAARRHRSPLRLSAMISPVFHGWIVRIGPKSYMQLSALLIKVCLITSPDVSTHLRPSSKGPRGWTFAETPLNAISRSNWSPESAEVRPLLKAPREDGSSFRAELDCS
jgi:hypothetical protein